MKEHLAATKKVIKITTLAFTFVLLILLLNFFIHTRRVNNYNSEVRTVDNFSNNTDVLVDIHPRGQATDSWEKTDAFGGSKVIYGKIYEATITNSSKSTLVNWNLRIDIIDDCWLNNAWNGDMEVHQFTDSGEKVQRISLLNYNKDDLTVDYFIYGQDLLIPLSAGDYIIYYPAEEASYLEKEIESNDYYNGSTSPGFIVYSITGDVDLTNYTLTYNLKKSIWSGTEASIFMMALPIWIVLMAILVIVSLLLIHFEKKIIAQSGATSDFMEAFVDYVDSKENEGQGHSKHVAECSEKIAKELGMSGDDCRNVYFTALVHDIGKCYVPDYILKKNKELTPEEEEQVRQHTVRGAEMLKNCTSIPNVADGALYHHERYDGKGYPFGKSGEEIPLVGRIIALADAYVLRVTSAGENIALLKDDIMHDFENDNGSRFDPVLVDVLKDLFEKGEV